MDRGDSQTELTAGEQGIEGVAAEASARVGAILAEAEREGRELNQQAERDAAEARREAEAEADRIMSGARDEALAAARERAGRLAELQSALSGRGPALLEGLEGEGLTRSRLEALIEALAASAERVVREVEEGAAAAAPAPGAETAAPDPAPDAASDPAPDAASDPPQGQETASGEEAEPEPGADASDAASAEDSVAAATPADPAAGTAGNGDGGAPVRYDGPLPEGAPLVRQPLRSAERDARFAALLLAVQGRERDDVEAHLRDEHGVDDCERILDEVFGRTPA